MTSARDYALSLLDTVTLPHWPAGLLPPRFQSLAAPADARDQALADHLYLGVLKQALTLQYYIEAHAHRPLGKVDPMLQKVLALGLYQLKYTRVPAHAAVDSAVTQAKSLGAKYVKSAGFVNAVLRNALREPAPPLPKSGDHRFAEVALSHPQEVFQRLLALLQRPGVLPIEAGDPYVVATRIAEHDNAEAPTIVRVRAGAALPEVEGVTITAHRAPGFYVVAPAKRALLAQWSAENVAQVQDPTAAKVVGHLDVRSGMNVLDRCCGVGTKTLQLLEALGGSGRVTAVDPNVARIATLAQTARQRGFENLTTVQAARVPPGGGQYDRILVDAPCSNSGVLTRRPEARYRQDAKTLASLNRLQRDILKDTVPTLAAGGLMIYSTCSLWPEENREITQHLLANHRDLALEHEELTLPSFGAESPTQYHDGGYFAVLRRRS